MKSWQWTIAMALVLLGTEANATIVDFVADMDAIQARAGAGSTCGAGLCPGTGTVTASFDTDTNELSWVIAFQDLSGDATVSHFHGPALPGAGAGARVVVPLGNGTSPIVGSVVLGTISGQPDADTQRDELFSGLWYVNLHTMLNGPGEIRGQVLPVARQSPLVRGDIVALDGNTAQVVKIHPASGVETLLSAQVAIDALLDVTVAPDGNAFAIDLGDRNCSVATRSLVHLDAHTGRSEIALPAIDADRVASDAMGRVYLLSDFLSRFDPASGAVDVLSYLGTTRDVAVAPSGEIYVMRVLSAQTSAAEFVRVDPNDGSFETVGIGGLLTLFNDSPRAFEVDDTGRLIVLQTNGGVGELVAIDPANFDPMSLAANQQLLTSGVLLSSEVQDLAVDAVGDLVVMQGSLAELVRVEAVSGQQALAGFMPIEGDFLDPTQPGQLSGGVGVTPDGRAVRALRNCQLGTTGLVVSNFDDGAQSFVSSTGLLNANGVLRLAVAADGSDAFVSAFDPGAVAPEVQIYRVDPELGLQLVALARGPASNAGAPIFDLDAQGRILFPDCQGLSTCETQSFDPANPAAPAVVTSGGPLESEQPFDLVAAADGFLYQIGSAQIPVRVDPLTGQQFGGMPTGDSGLPAFADRLAVTQNGEIYAASDSILFRTGTAGGGVIVGIGGLLQDIQAIAAGPSGEIYAATPTAIVRIDPTGNPAVNQVLVAALPDRSLLDLAVVMPEPSAQLLGSAALGALLSLLRTPSRRRG